MTFVCLRECIYRRCNKSYIISFTKHSVTDFQELISTRSSAQVDTESHFPMKFFSQCTQWFDRSFSSVLIDADHLASRALTIDLERDEYSLMTEGKSFPSDATEVELGENVNSQS